MIRAVLDANVIVSGVIRQAGPPGQLLKGALEAGKFTLVTSPFLLREVAEALWEEKIRKYHRWDQGQLLAFVARLHRHSQVTPGQLQVRVIADDPDDNAVRPPSSRRFSSCGRQPNTKGNRQSAHLLGP